MKTGAWWTALRTTFPGDYAYMTPSPAGPAVISLKGDFDWDYGELNVSVGVTTGAAGADCDVEVGVDGGATQVIGTFTSPGQHSFAASSLSPPFTLTDLKVHCDYTGVASAVLVDYVNVLNGEYHWPPPGDHDIAWIDTSFHGGGYSTTVVRSHTVDGELLSAADNGGVLFSDDAGQTWTTINGESWPDKIAHQDQLAVMEVEGTDTNRIYALSAREFGGALSGALYETTDLGETWTEVSTSQLAERTWHHCEPDTKAHAGGRHMLSWFGSGLEQFLFVVDHQTSPGVYTYLTSSGSTVACDGGAGLPGLPTDEYVSSLAVVPIGDDDYLAVGYKTVTGNGDAVYLCELDGDCSSGVASSCVAVSDSGWDVRDIEVDVVDANTTLLYVADAGRRRDAAGDCETAAEGTVQVVELQSGGGTATWNSDESSGSGDCHGAGDCPSWLDASYTSILNGTSYGNGELRVKMSSTGTVQELTGLAFDADSATLMAFVRHGSGRSYDFQRVYKADVTTPPSDASPLIAWVPLQDYSTGETRDDDDPASIDSNHEERADAVVPDSGWLDSLDPYDDLEMWFPVGPEDGLFVEDPETGVVDVVVNGGFGLFRIPESSGTTPGWDSPYGDAAWDLDEIPISWSIGPGSDFQQVVPTTVRFCDSCSPSGKDADGMAWATAWDLTMEYLYGAPLLGSSREPGLWECHFDRWSAGGRDIDLWEAGDGSGTAWAVLWQQASGQPENQAVIKAEFAANDDHTDIEWCFETTDDYHTTGAYDAFWSNGKWRCDRDPTYFPTSTWPACDPLTEEPGELLTTATGTYGAPLAIDVLEDSTAAGDVALASFSSYHDGSSYSARGGLALFYDSAGDMALHEVPWTAPSACATWTEDEVFEGAPRVAIDQTASTWTDSSDFSVVAYVALTGAVNTDDGCALLKAEIGPSSTTWTAVPIGSNLTGACSNLLAGDLQGLTLADWAPDTVFLYGIDHFCEVDVTDPASPTAADLAFPGGVDRRIVSASPHPHLADTLVVGFGTQAGVGCSTCEEPALFEAGWRRSGSSGSWKVAWNPYPDTWMANPNVTSVDFDVDETATPYSVMSFWVSTSGSGVLEGDDTWSLSP